MKAYVITTKGSKRLLNGEIKHYPDCLPECEAVYGPEPNEDNIPPDWFTIHRKGELTRRHAWCCYLSKLHCLEDHIKRYPNEDCIILEDDVTFSKHFTEVYTGFMRRVPKDWAILWFEYKTNSMAKEVVPLVLTTKVCWLASMLVFNHKYIPELIEDLKKEKNLSICEIDVVLSSLSGKYPSYMPLFSICGQRSGYSHIAESMRMGHGFTTTMYKSLNGVIKVSSDKDYKLYL